MSSAGRKLDNVGKNYGYLKIFFFYKKKKVQKLGNIIVTHKVVLVLNKPMKVHPQLHKLSNEIFV